MGILQVDTASGFREQYSQIIQKPADEDNTGLKNKSDWSQSGEKMIWPYS